MGLPPSLGTERQESIESRLRCLEDREEIRQLLINYGRTLDQKDFSGFSKLFTENAEYGVGDTNLTNGAAAIGRQLEEVMRINPSGLRSPGFHLFVNEIIQLKGNEAVAVSKGFYVVPGETNAPQIAMLATYNDVLIRENGGWKFRKRVVHGDLPAPPESK
jgi:hypothetical protein